MEIGKIKMAFFCIVAFLALGAASGMGLSHSDTNIKMFPGSERSFYFTIFNTNSAPETYTLILDGDELGFASIEGENFTVPANDKYSGTIMIKMPPDFSGTNYQFRLILSTIVEGDAAGLVSTGGIINLNITVPENGGTTKILSVNTEKVNTEGTIEVCVEAQEAQAKGFLKLSDEASAVHEAQFYVDVTDNKGCSSIPLGEIPNGKYKMRVDVYAGESWDNFESELRVSKKGDSFVPLAGFAAASIAGGLGLSAYLVYRRRKELFRLKQD
jgi:hypothetical protein